MAVASIEVFLNRVIGVLVDERPQLLRESKDTFSATRLLDAQNLKQIHAEIRNKFISDRTNTFDRRNKFLVTQLGDEASTSVVDDIVVVRNELVHHAGVVTANNVAGLPDSRYQAGDRLAIKSNTTKRAIERLVKYASQLVTMARQEAGR